MEPPENHMVIVQVIYVRSIPKKAKGIVDACGNVALQACSACAGEYEDPDRTVPPEREELAKEAGEGDGEQDDSSDGEWQDGNPFRERQDAIR
jgi:hypothetical protein